MKSSTVPFVVHLQIEFTKYGKAYGGSNPELVESDVFRSIVKYPDCAIYEKDSTVTPQVFRLLNVLKEGELNCGLLMEKVGLHDRKSFGKNYLQSALEQDLIEMNQSGSPKSPTQKYRLTNEGKRLLESMQK